MSESSTASQRDQELRELRERAYGPHADIQDDPMALARLVELESVRLDENATRMPGGRAAQEAEQVAPTTVAEDEAPMAEATETGVDPGRRRSLGHAVTATQTGRVWTGVSLAVIVAVGVAATWVAARGPQAALQRTGIEADPRILSAVSFAPLAEVDATTLRGYEAYRGVEPWVADGAQGSRCLMAIEAGTLRSIRCAPSEAELTLDIGAWPLDDTYPSMEGLADGTVIRFQLDGESVHAYLYPPPDTD